MAVDLKTGSYYKMSIFVDNIWKRREVIAKIVSFDDSGVILACKVKVLDPVTGHFYEIKNRPCINFGSEISIEDVRAEVKKINQRLIDFMEQ